MLKCFDLTGKTVIVTGATQGLGKGFAKALAKSGANLSIIARNKDKLITTTEELKEYGVECIWHSADITDEKAISDAVDLTIKKFGRIDGLINNAAAGIVMKPPQDNTLEDWNSILVPNINGCFIVAKTVGKQMIKQRYGKIVNLASIASHVFNRVNYPGAYEVSKGAVSVLTRCLAHNWCQYNINVNAIAPGYFLTEINQDFVKEHPETYEFMKNLIPMGRFGESDEIGALGVFMVSDAANYMQGSIVVIDGGRMFW